MRLPELLIEGGVIDAAAVELLLEAQSQYGGSFDTNLLEEGQVSERTLQPYLERAFEVKNEIDVFGEPAKDAVARLPRRQAETARICPFRLAKRTLEVVVADPSDRRAIDEIGFVTGHEVRVNVACEARVAYLLHRAYGIPIAHRLLALMQGKTWPKPEVAERRARARQDSAGEIDAVAPGVEAFPEEGSLPPPAPPAPVVWTPFALPRATTALLHQEVMTPQPSGPLLVPAVVVPPIAAPPLKPAVGRNGTSGGAPAAGFDVIAAQLEAVSDKEQIPPIALGFLATRLPRAVLLSVRKADVHGWDARGPRLRREHVEALSLPLDRPSVFAEVAARGQVYEGPLPHGQVEAAFLAALGADAAGEHVVIAPIPVHSRTAALLYGEAHSVQAAHDAREAVAEVGRLVGEALLRLILEKKQAGKHL